MAVELGRKIVKDTQQFANYAIGITLPLTFGENTFEQSFLTKDQVKSNIKNLLLTKRVNEFYNLNLVVDYNHYYLNQMWMTWKVKLKILLMIV